MFRLLLLLTLLPFFSTSSLTAQLSLRDEPGDDAPPTAHAARTLETITIDGLIDEPAYFQGKPADNFWYTFPTDTNRAAYQTEIFFTYDDNFLYVGAKCYVGGDDYVIPSLRRDYSAGGNDNITFVFNPFRDRTNAIVFGMNPFGVTREALIYNGGENGDDFREEWDNTWNGASHRGDGFWSCELRIPFRTLRFPAGQTEWYFNSYRFDMQDNTRSTWHRIPQNQIIMSLAYMGSLTFDDAPVQNGGKVSVIPYIGGGLQRDFQEPDGSAEFNFNLGGDAKIAVSTGLNLDLTVNPDFSQVEVDEQVINTTRFELFFPERRQFFLENADLFGSFGFGDANPFFSRRIGVTRDTSTGEGLQNPIYAGARLSGKLTDDWRVGLLNMQTAPNLTNGLPSFNYTVAAAQRVVGKRSNIGLIGVNKQNFSEFSDTTATNRDYNRVLGLDYNLQTVNNKWNGKTFLHKSFSPEAADGNGFNHGLNLAYRTRPFTAEYSHQLITDDFNAEVGFVPRRGIFSTNAFAAWSIYPGGRVVRKGPNIDGELIWADGQGQTDRSVGIGYDWAYSNSEDLGFDLDYNYIFLLDDFDPSRTGATPLPGDRAYDFISFSMNYSSDRRKKFSYSVRPSGGQFFNGYLYSLSGSVGYRYQPFGSINLNFNYRYIDLPAPYASTGLLLIGPRIDFTFTRSLFLTTFIQYNEQLQNVNINARLQWRFAPVSDFFLVYTDNYDSMGFGQKNRALVGKVTYWLNL